MLLLIQILCVFCGLEAFAADEECVPKEVMQRLGTAQDVQVNRPSPARAFRELWSKSSEFRRLNGVQMQALLLLEGYRVGAVDTCWWKYLMQK